MKTTPHYRVLTVCIIASTFVFGLCFAMVPLYNKLCRTTGLNGRVDLTASAALTSPVVLNHTINMQFVTTNNGSLNWDFRPEKTILTIHPEENIKTYFYVKNNTKHTITVQAVPSITPWQAAKHLHKIECFCFRQQTLAAGASLRMPVIFRIDNTISNDIKTVTLAYTLFKVKG